MREIKFRIWNAKTKKFTTGYEDQNRVCYDELYSDPPGLFFGGLRAVERDDNYTLQQFVGLKDINGKEIYEGDIIQLEGAPYFYEIKWNVWQWGIDSWGIISDDIQGFTSAVQKRAVVVGNIFENKDLLE